MTTQDGATPVPAYAQDSKEICTHEKDNPKSRTGKHCYRWVWINGKMTDRIRCWTCGFERENK